MDQTTDQDPLVSFVSSQGTAVRGNCVRLSRSGVVFEVYDPNVVLHLSEVLSEFRVCVKDQVLYLGRAVTRSVIQTGVELLCEVTLEDQWYELDAGVVSTDLEVVRGRFQGFLKEWQGAYRVGNEFKVAVGDLFTFLTDLRLWLEQAELAIRSAPDGGRADRERQVMDNLRPHLVPAINALHEQFEAISSRIEPELRGAHQNYARRLLHGSFLCSPFGFRAFQKPLGYAGDYEIVNMITRDPYEGASLFAKAMNLWLLSQYPSVAHRNRLAYLRQRLEAECLRTHTAGRPARILNVGCGPAHELQQFYRESPLAERTETVLVDFNEETLAHARDALEQARRQGGRRCTVSCQKKSVLQLLKEASKSFGDQCIHKYDFIYCAGLFDYLTDRTCRQLTGVFYNNLAPGGLLVVTNVDDCRPFRHMLEFLLDWHLVYRNRTALSAMWPEQAQPEDCAINADATGTNLFLEVRRPEVGS